MKKIGDYEYSIRPHEENEGYCYSVYLDEHILVKSDEIFETKIKAELAAVGHITLIENGDSKDA